MTHKSLSESVRDILNENGTANAATLKPGSKHKDPMPVSPAKVVDIGKAPVKPTGEELPDPLKGTKGKDTSKSSVSAVKGEPMKKLKEEEETVDTNQEEVVDDVITEEDEILTEDDLLEIVAAMEEDGLSEEEIQENLATILEDYEEVEVDEDGQVVVSEEEEPEVVSQEKPELDLNIDLTQDMEALFSGEELSEAFKEKAKTIFETVVKARLVEYQAKLDEAFETNLAEAVNLIESNITEDVEKYLDYVVEEWIGENEVAIEAGLRTEITEDFIAGFRNLCLEHNIELPEDKVDILEDQAARIAELEDALNEEITKNVELKVAIQEAEKEVAFEKLTEGLLDTEVEKLRQLTETIKFVDEDSFTKTLTTLRESYFPNKGVVSKDIDNDEKNKDLLNEETQVSPAMKKYTAVLDRQVPKKTQ